MTSRSGYVLCGTPRTGSTLLCSLLSSTGVLGRPESYFRQPDEASTAQRLGVPVDGIRAHDYNAFLQAAKAVATTDNGVWAARIMWGSLVPIVERLDAPRAQGDLVTLEQAFGPMTFLYLRREDVFGQAASWARAEQTHFWQQGDVALREPEEDLALMKTLLRTIDEHNEAWQSWFGSQGVEPHGVTYEQLVRDPRGVVEGIADRMSVRLPTAWEPASEHRRQADEINHRWATSLQAAHDNG